MRILLGKGLIYKCVASDHHRDYEEWDYMHVRFFTYRGFRRFLQAAGLVNDHTVDCFRYRAV